MDFIYYNLGFLNGGENVEVELSNAANVILLDDTNFASYKKGLSFNYRGGYIKTSPFLITVPYSGQWYIVIDLGGDSGYISHSCCVIDKVNKQSINKNATQIETLKWQIQDDNPDCTVKVTSNWLKKHPEYGDPNTLRTDFLVFDKKSGNLHKHFSIGEDTNWELMERHTWR